MSSASPQPSVRFSKAAEAFADAAGKQDWKTAERYALTMVQLQPENPSVHYNLAIVLRRQGRSDDALAALQRALQIMPGHDKAVFERACVLMDAGRLSDAVVGFHDYLLRAPDDHDTLVNLSRLHLRLGDAGSAHTCISRLDQTDGETRLLQAEVARDQGRSDTMLQLLRTAVAAHPDCRAAALKIATQGTAGRLPLNPSDLF